MRHQYIDIPAQPQPLQEYLWERQKLAQRIGEAAIILNAATMDYNGLINDMIQLNTRIREEEENQ